jgi:hypothetical protein
MKDLAAAMAKAQTQIKAAIKDTTGQIGQNRAYKYADLASVWDACKKALSENGIAVIQKPDFNGSDMWLETMLLHSSGDCITGRYPLRPTQDTPQAYGSALTYARRYSLSSMVGIVTDEDDDGAAGSKRDEEPAHDPALDAAKAFVRKAIKEAGATQSDAALTEWVKTWGKHIEKLRDKFPEEAKAVEAAIFAQRGSFGKVAAE